ncbi:MAG: hypothetical protein ACJ8AD_05070 [Gemmatimonadaceae bacterium]
MKTSIAVAGVALASVLSTAGGAQYRAPAGVQRLELSVGSEPTGATRYDTTVAPHEISIVGGLIGGLLGGVGGAFLGTVIGASSARGCQGEYCAFGPAIIGFALGEPIGLAIGTHLGARGRGNVAATAISSIGILVGGLVVAGAAPRGTPPVAIALIPAAQLVMALAMER